MKKIIVTGSAGFIGFHFALRLLQEGYDVLGIDSLSHYYDKNLKIRRNLELKRFKSYSFHLEDLSNLNKVKAIFREFRPDVVVHLAAQAGVRYSIENPEDYITSNILGTFSVLESVKELKCKHLIIASTSSIYGANKATPFLESDKADLQLSLYAASKKSVEAITHSYSHLFNIPTSVCRFFTVYGPWGRPDMALFKFTSAILSNEKIEVFNRGNLSRDFTFIKDIEESLYRLIHHVPSLEEGAVDPRIDTLSRVAPWRIINIGNGQPIKLMDFIKVLEEKLEKKADMLFCDMQAGDVKETFADNRLLMKLIGFKPETDLSYGISKFVSWYKSYYSYS